MTVLQPDGLRALPLRRYDVHPLLATTGGLPGLVLELNIHQVDEMIQTVLWGGAEGDKACFGRDWRYEGDVGGGGCGGGVCRTAVK